MLFQTALAAVRDAIGSSDTFSMHSGTTTLPDATTRCGLSAAVLLRMHVHSTCGARWEGCQTYESEPLQPTEATGAVTGEAIFKQAGRGTEQLPQLPPS